MIIKKITPKNFRKFGWVIEFPKRKQYCSAENLFRIVLREKGNRGWRIAYLVVRDRAIHRLEQHPESFESFEPIRGESLLYVVKEKDAEAIECFYLDRPIILKKGMWHGIVALSKEADVKITENAKVKSVRWRLGFSLNSKLHINTKER